jgi:hypothetical protein
VPPGKVFYISLADPQLDLFILYALDERRGHQAVLRRLAVTGEKEMRHLPILAVHHDGGHPACRLAFVCQNLHVTPYLDRQGTLLIGTNVSADKQL